LVTALVIAAIAALVVVLGPAPRYWPQRMPVLALVAGAVALFALSDLPFDLFGLLGYLGWIHPELVSPLTIIMMVLVALLAVIAGLALAAAGRLRGRGDLAVMGLMIVLIALVKVSAALDQIQAQLGMTFLPQPEHILAGMEILVALLLLGQLVWLLVRRPPLATWAVALVGPFVALAGLYAVDWYGNFVLGQVNAAPSSVVLLALIFLVQELWDVSRSGDPITNGDSPAAPRSGRVQLYFGYILVTAALFLYGSSLRIQATGGIVPGDLTGVDSTSALTAFFLLCPAVAILTGLVRWQQWRVPLVGVAAPVRVERERYKLVAILGVGAVLVAALVVVTGIVVIPRAEPQTYFTHLPGPNCDTQGAAWTQSSQLTLICNHADGLHVTVPSKIIGEIGFDFPGGLASNNYRATVHVTFGATDGCAGIFTRASPSGLYQSDICQDGEWGIFRIIFGQKTHSLAIGTTQSASGYTITATTHGTRQTIAINGVTLATAVDSQLSTGSIDLFVFNAGRSPAPVILSDFSYTPLS
jgi:hypothetical protein